MASASTLGIALLLSANTRQARNEVASFTKYMSSEMKKAYESGQKMSQRGNDIMKSGLSDLKTGIAALAPVIGIAKEAMNFEDAMADVAKVANLDRTSEEFKGLSKDAMQLSEHLATNADDVGKLYASLLSGGTAQQDLKDVANIAGEAAVAFDMSQEAAGNAFMTMQNAMGLSVKEAQKAFDATNAITNKFGGKASEILDFMVQGGASVARTLGSTAPQMEAFGRALMKSGISSSEAGTIMQRFQLGLYNNAEALKVFKKAGGGSEGIAAVFELAKKSGDPFKWFKEHKFGQYSSQMSLLAKNMGSVQEMLQFVGDEGNYAGSAHQEFANRATTTSFKLKHDWQALKNSMITAGNSLLPAIKSIADALLPIIKAIGNFVAANPGLVKALAVLVTSFAGFKFASGLFKISFGSIFQTIGQFKSFTAIAGDSILTMRLRFLYLGDWLKGPFLSGITKFGSLLKSGFTTAFSAIGKAVGAASRFLLANPIILIITAIAVAAFLIYKNWDKIKVWFANLWAKVKEIFSTTWAWLKDLFFKYHPLGLVIKNWDKIKDFFKDLWQKVKEIFSATWEWIKEVFNPVNLIKDAMSKIKSILPGFLTGKSSVNVNGPTMALAGVPAAASISTSKTFGSTNHFAPVINLSGNATQADANLISNTMKKQFDRLMKDHDARQQRIKF